MFGIIATVVFVTAASFSSWVIATMFIAYREKMTAALLFQPMPLTQPVYHVEVRRRRVRPIGATIKAQGAILARAA